VFNRSFMERLPDVGVAPTGELGMVTLLRDLPGLRRSVALLPPGRGRSLAIRNVDAGSCRDLRIPGCPPPPDAIAAALLCLIDESG
jgi:hypothetical protein